MVKAALWGRRMGLDAPVPDMLGPADFGAARDLIAQAKYAKEAEDLADFAAVWAKDATLSVIANDKTVQERLHGREAILNFSKRNWEKSAHGAGAAREVHIFERPYVTVQKSGRLLARYTVAFFAMPEEDPFLVGFGEFEDEIIREDGGLRIISRRSTFNRRAMATPKMPDATSGSSLD